MTGCVQWISVFGWKDFRLKPEWNLDRWLNPIALRKAKIDAILAFLSAVGLTGQRLTHLAIEMLLYVSDCKYNNGKVTK